MKRDAGWLKVYCVSRFLGSYASNRARMHREGIRISTAAFPAGTSGKVNSPNCSVLVVQATFLSTCSLTTDGSPTGSRQITCP